MKTLTKADKLTAAIAYYMRLMKIKNEDIEKALDICPATRNKLMKTGDFSFSQIVTLAEMFHCSVGDLTDGELRRWTA
jgi:hypothetical protein